jgi:hypothetical protein
VVLTSLGEDPEEFEELRQGLYDSWPGGDPKDGGTVGQGRFATITKLAGVIPEVRPGKIGKSGHYLQESTYRRGRDLQCPPVL